MGKESKKRVDICICKKKYHLGWHDLTQANKEKLSFPHFPSTLTLLQHTILLTPDVWEFSPTMKFLDTGWCLKIQLNSDIIYLEIA